MPSKIQDYVIKNNVKPKECEYHTNRTVNNSKNEPTGSIRVLVHKDNLAMCEYKCPECLHSGYAESEWKRPFSIKCEKCNNKISVPKLREQAKRELKAENAKKSK